MLHKIHNRSSKCSTRYRVFDETGEQVKRGCESKGGISPTIGIRFVSTRCYSHPDFVVVYLRKASKRQHGSI